MEPVEPVVDVLLALRREQDGTYRADLTLRRPASDTDYALVQGQRVTLDRARLLAAAADPVAYGRVLAAQVFADADLRRAWDQALTVGAATRQPLQVRLDLDPQDDDLHRLVWETLTTPDGSAALATSERVRLSRYLATGNLEAATPPLDAPPHALVIVANPTNLPAFGLHPVDVAGEVGRIRAALGEIPTTVLASGEVKPPTRAAIRDTLRERPTLCFLVCHGSLVDDEPYLWLEGGDGQVDQVSGGDLLTMLDDLGVYPRLIVLGSCRSGGDGDRVLPALAPRLVQRGTPAVIGAQGDVPMEVVAGAFPVLIRELRRDGRIDRALAASRAALGRGSEWWRLALWTHRRDGRLWSIPWRDGPAASEREKATIAHGVSPFVSAHLRVTFLWAETFGNSGPTGCATSIRTALLTAG